MISMRIIAKICIEHGFAPACAGMRQPDPAFAMNVMAANHDGPVDR